MTLGTSRTSAASLRLRLPSCLVASVLYKVRETSLIQEERWLVSLSSWLGQNKRLLSQIHHVLNWLPFSTMAFL